MYLNGTGITVFVFFRILSKKIKPVGTNLDCQLGGFRLLGMYVLMHVIWCSGLKSPYPAGQTTI